MHDDAYERLISTRTSMSYYDQAAEDEPALMALLAREYPPGFHSSMFTEDASQILPYGRGIGEGFTVTVDADVDRTKNLIRQALPSRYGIPLTIEDGIRNFVEDSAAELISGTATYEVDYLQESPSSADPCGFRIERIDSRTLGKKRGAVIQYVPRKLGGKAKNRGLHYVVLPKENLVEIRPDTGTQKAVQRAMAVFRGLDAAQSTPLDMLQDGDATNSAFSVSEHISKINLVALRATKSIGWTGRDLFTGDEMLEPYSLWRALQFLRFKIQLRETILGGLQEIIDHAGKRLGFDAQLKYSGLLSISDVEEAQKDLAAAHRSMSELFRLLSRG